VDWLASGKFALCLFCSDIDKAKRQGLPVDSLELVKGSAGLVSHYGTLGLVNKAPHPNAARVFIHWLLSREGQLTLQKALSKAGDTVPDSLRIDIPKDDVASEDRRQEGVRYVDLDSRQEWLDRRPILRLFEEALTEGKRRK
jgi:ABC-type Fe3+ transport system substrate-binding protein